MNRREASVVILLIVALTLGAGIAMVRRGHIVREQRDAPLAVSQAVTDAATVVPVNGAGQLLDLNTATASQLEALPGIGHVLGLRIIDYRTTNGGFKSVGQLRHVSGIGPKRYAALKELVFVGASDDTGP